jgi:hypothetical protein
MGAGSKTRRRAQKTLDKRERLKLPELAGVPRKPKAKLRGQARMVEIDQERADDAQRTVLEARARMIGVNPDSREDRDEMRAQSYGDEAGRAISLYRKGEARQRLLDAYRGLTAAEERYHRIVLGKSIHAKTAKIEMEPERLETSADDAPPDLRSEDDRHRDAVNTWMRWKGYTQCLCAAHRNALWNASRGLVTLHKGDVLTPHGRAFVLALEALADEVG